MGALPRGACGSGGDGSAARPTYLFGCVGEFEGHGGNICGTQELERSKFLLATTTVHWPWVAGLRQVFPI